MTFVKLRAEEYAALSARALGRLVANETALALRERHPLQLLARFVLSPRLVVIVGGLRSRGKTIANPLLAAALCS